MPTPTPTVAAPATPQRKKWRRETLWGTGTLPPGTGGAGKTTGGLAGKLPPKKGGTGTGGVWTTGAGIVGPTCGGNAGVGGGSGAGGGVMTVRIAILVTGTTPDAAIA